MSATIGIFTSKMAEAGCRSLFHPPTSTRQSTPTAPPIHPCRHGPIRWRQLQRGRQTTDVVPCARNGDAVHSRALSRTLTLSRSGGTKTTWDVDLLLPVPEDELWGGPGDEDEGTDLSGDDDAEEHAQDLCVLGHAQEEYAEEEHAREGRAEEAEDQEWSVLGAGGAGSEWDMCSETSSLAPSWALLGEDACSEASSLAPSWALLGEAEAGEQPDVSAGGCRVLAPWAAPPGRGGSFAEVLLRQGGAGDGTPSADPRPSGGATRLLLRRARAQPAAPASGEEGAEDGLCPGGKDARGGRWTRQQRGTRSVKQLQRVEMAVSRRAEQRARCRGKL